LIRRLYADANGPDNATILTRRPNCARPRKNDEPNNGGLMRAKRLARITEKFGRTIVPHNTQTGATSVHILQVRDQVEVAIPVLQRPTYMAPKPKLN
jgi:hypothetical protein